jgi:hypothetical protein
MLGAVNSIIEVSSVTRKEVFGKELENEKMHAR